MANHHQPIFCKHLPPPTILGDHYHQHTADHSPSVNQLFEQKIQAFLSDRQNADTSTTCRPAAKLAKLSTIKQELTQLKISLDGLKSDETNLRCTVAQLTTEQWIDTTNALANRRKAIEETIAKYESPAAVMKCVRQLIAKRLRKRLKLKALKSQRNHLRLANEKRRALLHDHIDRWQSERIANEQQMKVKHQQAERVPQVLGGVTKKKAEAKKYLAVLESLIELRRVRQIQSGKRQTGEMHFREQIDKLKTVWSDALENSENDERELRKYLGDDNGQATIESGWKRMLFGVDAVGVDVRNPLLKANYFVDDFIAMR